MSDWGVVRWIAGKFARLPSRQYRRLRVDRDIPAKMRDGVELLADRHYPSRRQTTATVLMRSPYGRGTLFGLMAQLLAERGFQVVVQSVRGTCGSGGKFDPMRQELADGVDTLNWVRAQPWFSGKLFTFGPSYLGNVQWAMAAGAPNLMDGLALPVTLSNFRLGLLGGGSFTQGNMLSWTELMRGMVNFVPGRRMRRPKVDVMAPIHNHLPVGTMDQASFGESVSWWQDWVGHDMPDDPWWQAVDHSAAVTQLTAPTTLIGGWMDVFLPHQINDFAARQAAGRDAWLTVGPWTHASLHGMAAGLREAITTFTALRNGQPPYTDRDRVRLFIQGAGIWRDYPTWPPPGGRTLHLYLRSGGRLEFGPPTQEEDSTHYIYDPADPTPAIHGLYAMAASKVRDMTALTQRKDTITFTSAPLEDDLNVIGPVKVGLSVRSDREHTDFYACLCEVDDKGRPIQVVDGFLRLRPQKPPADSSGARRITIECWPTAYRFKQGRQIKLIVASGSHPRYARNPGTGEPLATATRKVTARQEVLHGISCPSSLEVIVHELTVRRE